jgi:4-amino-4-deoxy-L-arabinose transferase-like glycosyltransferase
MTATARSRDAPDERVAMVPAGRHARPVPDLGQRARAVLAWSLGIGLPVLAVLAVAAFLRFWQLDAVGFNSDEAVYTGTAASIAGNPSLSGIFPIFRAHPVLFQMLLSLLLKDGVSDGTARALPALIGVCTVAVTYLLGRRLYGHGTGLIGALFLAVMTYHVVVSRQVLLDGLMTLCATGVLYCMVRYSETGALRWILASGAMMGASVLAKETSIVLVGGLYAYFALTPTVRLRFRHLVFAGLTTIAVVMAFPVALSLSGQSSVGQNYLLWQLFRRSNHPLDFYLTVVPSAVGFLVLAAAIGGLVWFRRENTWRERLLLCWCLVPIAFFTLWPVKGYQYLLPIAPVAAILAGRTIFRLGTVERLVTRRGAGVVVRTTATAAVVFSLLMPTWNQITSPPQGTFLAGTGGVAGGREAGLWLRDNVPSGAQLMTIGPSMANILQFYGLHKSLALSVSTNPMSRNPSYTPVANPDATVRSGAVQYLVWDSYTAARTPFFAAKLQALVERYHGRKVFTVPTGVTASGTDPPPAVIIYQVQAP